MTPARVSTPAELDALPVGSVVRGNDGHPWEKVYAPFTTRAVWHTVRSHGNYESTAAGLLPATLLHVPDRDLLAEARQYLAEVIGEAVHTALRKACDSDAASRAHAAIRDLPDDEWRAVTDWAADAALAQPVACSLPHLVPVDESEDDGFGELPPWRPLAAQPVEPEPDEREAVARLVAPACWAAVDRNPEYGRTTGTITWSLAVADRLAAAGFRRSRPEATHTVTAEQRDAAWQVLARHGVSAALPSILAALGVTVADTPTQAGDDA